MPERPLLILPSPTQPVLRSNKFGGGGPIGRPSRERQADRLGPKFTALQEAFDALRARLQVVAAGTTPEKVLVLETAGSIEDFILAVQNIDGMEWLGEIQEEEIPPDDDFFALDTRGIRKPDKKLRGQVFLVFSNQQALNQMLSLWRIWERGEPLPYGYRKWDQVLFHLRHIHPWGIKERLLETGVLDDWRERVEHKKEVLPCEIELWFRRNPIDRTAASSRVIDLIKAQKGRVLKEAILEEIAYHGLLVELPVAFVSKLLEGPGDDIGLVICEQIQFFRASGQMAGILPEDERIRDDIHAIEPERDLGDPIVALLDGFPLQQHSCLSMRIAVDDPHNIEAHYQAQERRHGTAMASLILHGDLNSHEQPLPGKLYVRPILQPDSRDWRRVREETVPENALVVDLIHSAVRRIFEGDGGEPATAPNVCIINLSIGIRDRLFDGALSPLARLLDWLAWKYQVLFIVSAGNHLSPLDLGITWNDFMALSPQDRQTRVIKATAAGVRNRRLLSPAEAVNVITIGALHSDHSGDSNIPRSVEPYLDQELPSLINAQGLGYRRSIKPELFAPGGKIVLTEPIATTQTATYDIYTKTLPPGQKVAAPGSKFGDISDAWYTRGTSNATALTSRAAALLYNVLEELQREPGGELIGTIPMGVWLKALLTHAAEWGTAGDVFYSILYSENSRRFKEYVTRMMGYGGIQIDRVRECAEHRVTALSGGVLENGRAHIHRFPLPPSLSGEVCWRRLTITLAWFTPVNPAHQKWRRAALWFDPPKDLLNVNRQQADWQAVKRGTIQHEVLEGEKASAFLDGDNLEIKVNCTADAGALEDSIPYALAATLEVKEGIEIPLYSEVRVRVHAARVRITSPE